MMNSSSVIMALVTVPKYQKLKNNNKHAMALNLIQGVYIADGFADDCEEVIHRCCKEETLTFEIFSEIWKDMQMGCVFMERNSGAEIAELSEEVIHIAKHYMVADTSNFEESVAGLFIVYALLNLQPFVGFASIRIVPEDVQAIKRIELVARRDRRMDVLYILGSVLIKGPVQYHAVLRERGMEYPIRKYLEGYLTMDRTGVRPKGVFYRQNEELDIIRELRNLSIRYSDSKSELLGPEQDKSLNYANKKFPEELDSSMKKLISGIINDEESDGDASEDGSVDSVDVINSIKQKAMKAQVKPIRHRVGVCTREERNPLEPEFKSPPKKVRKVSPKIVSPKIVTTTKNRSINKVIKRRKRTPKIVESDEENEPEETSPEPESINKDDYGEELDLVNFHKETPETVSNEQEVNINLDCLPCFITSQEGEKSYEIEIIDHLNPEETERKVSGTIQASTSNTVAKKEKSERLKRAERRDLKKILLKKADKRDQKKTIIKSRFKRMGMLPVANFQNKE